jgi:AHBA synthesis associated protein
MRPAQAIIFDLDGVLVDSEELIRFAFERSFAEIIGDDEPPTELFLEHMGEYFPVIMDALGRPHTLWEPFKRISTTHRDLLRPFPGARPFLTELRSQGLRIGVLTGKDRTRTLDVLEHLHLRALVDVVVAGDDTDRAKPDPSAMRLALQQFDVPASRAIMVGDSVSDIECARAAGVKAIAVGWGIRPERLLQTCLPDEIARSWQELRSMVQRWSAVSV